MTTNLGTRRLAAMLGALALLIAASAARADDKPPITIGFSIEQTGGLSAVGKTGLLAFQIWADNVNKKGGLLGRQVKLVFYDDQSNPANVPGIYTKLLDVDKVDLVVSSYATNLVAPAMPIVMQKNRLFFGLFALAINVEFHYPKYFSMLVFGPDPKPTFSKGFFELAMAQNPKPKTVALVTADAEFGRNALDGARDNVKAAGLQIVYDKAYPPTTVDYTPIVRAVQATNPDVVYVASYPPDTVGILRAVKEIGYQPPMLGGTMVGTAAAAFRTQLGPLLNGVVVGENWEPAKTMDFPGIWDFLKQYQPLAKEQGVDPLGYFLPPFAYAEMQVLEEAIKQTGGLDEDKLADYIHSHPFKTIVGEISFGADGEWTKPQNLFVQYHGLKTNDIEQFRDDSHVSILYPPQFKTGELIAPYAKAGE
ncbi:MAG TPA: amino acid ABC transporter substrate-binding protein [Stellaceae bacterium]|jgi:branched-chain amino acid transport system substrate-binding protein|nr:amino acid ABC transporter substrate-binding protein [Stellaceae bacterium]